VGSLGCAASLRLPPGPKGIDPHATNCQNLIPGYLPQFHRNSATPNAKLVDEASALAARKRKYSAGSSGQA